MLKKLWFIFVLAFLLNLIWEYWHSRFYQGYQGAPTTHQILWLATFFDALIILGLVLIAEWLKINQTLLLIVGGLVASTLIEIWALQTGRWAYNSFMPLVPILNVGLTPFVQLGLTGFITQKICQKIIQK